MEPIVAMELLLPLIDSEQTNQLLELSLVCAMNNNKVPKVKNYLALVNSLDDDEFQKNFRLSRTTCNKLTELFANSDFYPKNVCGKSPKSPETHILAFVWYAANKATLQGTSQLFDMATSTLHGAVNRVMKFLLTAIEFAISFTRDNSVKVFLVNELQTLAQAVDKMSSRRSIRMNQSKAESIKSVDELNNSIKSKKIEWTIGCSQFLLDRFVEFYCEVGPIKEHRNKLELWKALVLDLRTKYDFVCTPEQCDNHLKSIKRSYKITKNKRKLSQSVHVFSPYDEGMAKLESLNNNVQRKILVGVSRQRRQDSPHKNDKVDEQSIPEAKKSRIIKAVYDIYEKKRKNTDKRFGKWYDLVECISRKNTKK